MDIDGTGHNLL